MGNNPFFKQQKKIAPTEKKSIQPVTQPLTLFEYKISAIWTVNDEFKALISGHIVKKGDTINELTILKITNKDITVRRKKKSERFAWEAYFMIFKFNYISLFIAAILTTSIVGEPSLSIERPKEENMTVYSGNVTFKGQTKNTTKLTINGLEIPLKDNGQFEHIIELNSKNGNNYFFN